MAYEKFIDINFKADTLTIIEQAKKITEDYQSRGFVLTLRQLFYQFVARDLLPNEQRQYKRLGKIVDNARQTGLLDWSMIEDRTRNVKAPTVWDSPESIIAAVADQYKEDLWKGQRYRPEIWVEKDALVGVVEPVANRYRVPYFACRGYASQSETYAAGKRFNRILRRGFIPLVLHLGDHDPSGIHMTVDNGTRLSLFAEAHIEIKRLALNMDQIEEFNPPPNPAKETDSRFAGYEEEYGSESWELDALDPDVIDKLVADALDEVIDKEAWETAAEEEEANKEGLQGANDHWGGVKRYLKYRDHDVFDEHGESIGGGQTVDEVLAEIESANE